MRVDDVDVLKIIVSHKRRPVSKATVKSLAASILDIGLQNPIGLTADYRLIHGRHRLEAYRELGWDTIPATIHDVDDMHAEMAEIDENIQRKQLTKVEECKALARRKEIYLAMHPETKRGGDRRSKAAKNQTANIAVSSDDRQYPTGVSFVSDTAAKTGKAERSVRDDVSIGAALPDDIAEKIADTPVANNKSELKKLAKLDEEEQQTVATLLSEGECQTVTEAIATHDEPEAETDPSEILKDRLVKLIAKWRKEFRVSHTLAVNVLKKLAADIMRAK